MKKCFKIKEHKRNGVTVHEHIRCVSDDNEITLEQQKEGLTYGEFWELKRNNKLKKPLSDHLSDRLNKSGYNTTIDYSAKSESTYLKVHHNGVYTKIRLSGHNNMISYLSDYNINIRSSVDDALNILRKQFKNLK